MKALTFSSNQTLTTSGAHPSNKMENKLCTLIGYRPERLVNQTRLTATVGWLLFPHPLFLIVAPYFAY